jgi:alpha-tubulin suppressor-like RCC1 family protein
VLPVRSGEQHFRASRDTCALDQNNNLYCGGDNEQGQLGIGTRDAQQSLVLVDGTGFAEVAAGEAHTCGARGGRVWCWGSNSYGQLGNGAFTMASSRSTSTRVAA